MGKFLSGLVFGGLICAFCATCYLPINIANDLRDWVHQPEVQLVQVDNQTDETQSGITNVLPDPPDVVQA